MLIYKYELLKMKEGKSIEDTFACFEKIIGELKVVEKTYLVSDQITEILKSLPSQWISKVVIFESMNFNTLSYDEV